MLFNRRDLEGYGATPQRFARPKLRLQGHGECGLIVWPAWCSTPPQNCALHIHGYTERFDARAKYSSPSAVGLMMAVGSVSEYLAPYKDSDTFLTRDGGFTWEEVHKDAHLFEYGDSGSIIVIVNDEEATDHVFFTTNEGMSWREYKFSNEKYRIRSIVTVPSDTSRKFILLGHKANDRDAAVAVHVDFSAITSRQCEYYDLSVQPA
jgi:hypothetical protein